MPSRDSSRHPGAPWAVAYNDPQDPVRAVGMLSSCFSRRFARYLVDWETDRLVRGGRGGTPQRLDGRRAVSDGPEQGRNRLDEGACRREDHAPDPGARLHRTTTPDSETCWAPSARSASGPTPPSSQGLSRADRPRTTSQRALWAWTSGQSPWRRQGDQGRQEVKSLPASHGEDEKRMCHMESSAATNRYMRNGWVLSGQGRKASCMPTLGCGTGPLRRPGAPQGPEDLTFVIASKAVHVFEPALAGPRASIS